MSLAPSDGQSQLPDWKLSNINAESSQLQSAAAPGGNKGRKAGQAARSNADGSLQPDDDDEDDPTGDFGTGVGGGAVASSNSTNIDGQPIQVSFGGPAAGRGARGADDALG